MSDVSAVPKRMSRAQRRASLVDAAGRVLARPQTHALTFEDVAAEAGVSTTLPYKYFSSIDELASALYDAVVESIDDAMDGLIESDVPFDDKVAGTWRLWADAIRSDGALLWAIVDSRSAPPLLKRRLDDRRERTVVKWAEVIEAEFGFARSLAMLVAASTVAGSSALHGRWIRDRRRGREVEATFVTLVRAQCEALARA